jgi:tetratricopeptide (TPR) repeat protein
MAKGRVAYAGRARLCIVGLFAAVLLQVPALHAENDDYSHFERAKNAFDAGEYKEAVSRFDALLKKQPKNAALVLECHKFIAVSYLFVGDKVAAEHHLTELLTITPDYDLDPMMFPMEIVDFFQEMKTKNKKQLDALSLARAREEAQRKATEEAQRKAELEKLKRNVYLERTRKKNSRLVAVIPFGAGQFQNGHIVK